VDESSPKRPSISERTFSLKEHDSLDDGRFLMGCHLSLRGIPLYSGCFAFWRQALVHPPRHLFWMWEGDRRSYTNDFFPYPSDKATLALRQLYMVEGGAFPELVFLEWDGMNGGGMGCKRYSLATMGEISRKSHSFFFIDL
jgi:hypothetical protein